MQIVIFFFPKTVSQLDNKTDYSGQKGSFEIFTGMFDFIQYLYDKNFWFDKKFDKNTIKKLIVCYR